MSLCSLWEIFFPALLAAPEIAHFAPHAVVPGRRTLLTFSGSNLSSASNLWTSFGGEAHRVANTNSGLISFSVNCPADARGIQALQLISPEGASGYQLLMVDSLKTQPHQDKHQSPKSAHKISPPAAVDCILKPEKIDYYKFAAKAGETWSIEVIADRIGSQMDPVARVLDVQGRELSFCDDEGGVWKDARFQFKAPAKGDYIIAVHDVGYGGGPAFDYRLRVTAEPLVWFTFPLVDQNETSVPFETLGSGVETAAIGSPANPPIGPALSLLPQIVETESNDNTSTTPPTAAPVILHGKIHSNADVDLYPVIADKNQKLVFQAQTRALGSPCDLVLRIKGPDGKIVAQSEMNLATDAAITNKFSQTGTYLLEVRELSGAGATNAPYRVKIQDFVPGFSVNSEKNILEIKAGESAKLKLNAVRYDYDGPIELRLESELPGLTIENNVIPEKKNEVELIFKASAELSAGTFLHLNIFGKSKDQIVAEVSTKPALKTSFPLMLNSPAVLDGLFTIAVTHKGSSLSSVE